MAAVRGQRAVCAEPLDGPRAAQARELPASVALCDAAFRRPPYTTSMADDFPRLFHAGNAANLRVVAGAGGAILAHAGSVRGTMRLGGSEVAAAALGAVTTRADMRVGASGQRWSPTRWARRPPLAWPC